jgi:hypothetical protein
MGFGFRVMGLGFRLWVDVVVRWSALVAGIDGRRHASNYISLPQTWKSELKFLHLVLSTLHPKL